MRPIKESWDSLDCASDQAKPSKGTLISDLHIMSKGQRCPTSSGVPPCMSYKPNTHDNVTMPGTKSNTHDNVTMPGTKSNTNCTMTICTDYGTMTDTHAHSHSHVYILTASIYDMRLVLDVFRLCCLN